MKKLYSDPHYIKFYVDTLTHTNYSRMDEIKHSNVTTNNRLYICPICQIELYDHSYGKVLIDVCRNCGGGWTTIESLRQLSKLIHIAESQQSLFINIKNKILNLINLNK